MLKVHYQNGTTAVCFKQICRFPDTPTPALTTGMKTKLKLQKMEMAAASKLHLTETNQEHSSVCCDCREDPKTGTGGGIPRTLYHSTRTLCKLPDQT